MSDLMTADDKMDKLDKTTTPANVIALISERDDLVLLLKEAANTLAPFSASITHFENTYDDIDPDGDLTAGIVDLRNARSVQMAINEKLASYKAPHERKNRPASQ